MLRFILAPLNIKNRKTNSNLPDKTDSFGERLQNHVLGSGRPGPELWISFSRFCSWVHNTCQGFYSYKERIHLNWKMDVSKTCPIGIQKDRLPLNAALKLTQLEVHRVKEAVCFCSSFYLRQPSMWLHSYRGSRQPLIYLELSKQSCYTNLCFSITQLHAGNKACDSANRSVFSLLVRLENFVLCFFLSTANTAYYGTRSIRYSSSRYKDWYHFIWAWGWWMETLYSSHDSSNAHTVPAALWCIAVFSDYSLK